MQYRTKEEDFAILFAIVIACCIGIGVGAMWMARTEPYLDGKAIQARIAECEKHTQAGEWCDVRVVPRNTPGKTYTF